MSLKEQYETLHSEGKFPGQQISKYVDPIRALVVATNALSLLDYGCGKAEPWQRGLASVIGVIPYFYDPYFPKYADRPHGVFDIVACVDVLEHVPEQDIEGVLTEIFTYAKDGVFLVISTKAAKKFLPDGRNCHLTVREPAWWDAQIDRLIPKHLIKTVIYTND